LIDKNDVFQYSRDLGETWTSVAIDKNRKNSWNATVFGNNVLGIAVGDNGSMAISTDYGSSWTSRYDITAEDLSTVQIQESIAAILGKDYFYVMDIK
jgi:photosystem II stability/assembly factor-like uncharacterized protein